MFLDSYLAGDRNVGSGAGGEKLLGWRQYSSFYLTGTSLYSGEGNGTPLQYSCLENPMGRGAWKAAVHGAAEGRTRLSDFTFTFHFHALEKEMATHSSILPGESQGWGSLVGCRLWGCKELDTTEVT